MDEDSEDLVVALLALRKLELWALDGENIPVGDCVAHCGELGDAGCNRSALG